MKIVFVGGIFLEEQRELIESKAKGNVQYAADSLQKAFLNGFDQIEGVETHLVNIPYISSFPRGDRQPWFPGIRTKVFSNISVLGKSFINILILRIFDRFRAAFAGLRQILDHSDAATIVVYSAHSPFLLAALLVAANRALVKTCLILPDFPEFMGDDGLKYKIISKINSTIFYALAPRFDYFVVLTLPMAEKMNLSNEQFTVVEGIYDPSHETSSPVWSTESGKIFIYTGTLAARYGILDLLQAFAELDNPDVRLWICGDGDAKQSVINAAAKDQRVVYHGLVSRPEALALQARAHVMVNPRRPEGEFTRYSFPSKTMEYLASGRPTIMHWLSGMPPEYHEYLIAPDSADALGLANAMRRVSQMEDSELQRIGASGRRFVLTEKGPKKQIDKFVKLLMKRRENKARCHVEYL